MVSAASVFVSPICASSLSIDRLRIPFYSSSRNIENKRYRFALKSKCTEMFGQQMVGKEVEYSTGWSFVEGLRPVVKTNLGRKFSGRKSSVTCASWLPNCQIASSAFTFGTVAVLPFYTSMVIAPRSEFTKKLVSSSIIYIVLGLMYAYLLYLSWTPDTIRLMFASKYWLPELLSISKLFSREMTLASAWIHLLVVDLFAARQVYYEGLQENIETRHSVSLCLMFCPIGIFAHFITKALTKSR